MTIATKALRTDSVAVTDTRVRLRLGLPWYRSLPWAGVDEITLELDGIDLGAALSIDGSRPEELATREQYWAVQQWAVAEYRRPPHIVQGTTAHARVRVHIRVPGPLQPDGSPMPYVFDEVRLVLIGDGVNPGTD